METFRESLLVVAGSFRILDLFRNCRVSPGLLGGVWRFLNCSGVLGVKGLEYLEFLESFVRLLWFFVCREFRGGVGVGGLGFFPSCAITF